MIITKLQGGLGNQLFQYAIGRRFAIDRNTDLKIDTDFYDNQVNVTKRDFKLKAFQINADFAQKADKLTVLGSPLFQPIKRRLWKMGFDIFHWNYIRENSYGFHSEVLNHSGSAYLDGYWQCPLYFDSIRHELLGDLTIKDEFLSEQFKKKSNEIINKNSVAIHVRRGDYVSNPIVNKQFGVCSVEFYINAIHYFSKKVDNVDFFVFSDDISWCKQNIVTKNALVQFVSGLSDYEDLILMSRCNHQIVSNSTFGWWGAWLNQNPTKIVIAPAVWYLDPTLDTTQLIPLEWIRL
ncbi:MAG: alpha-1,2-fucosyltransferase [Paludibacter sp.]